MKVKPMLGSFALDSIEYIESSESRALVEHRVPGLEGSYFQDMGSVPNTIVIAGTKHGDEPRDKFLEGIREIFNAGEPTTFVADINTATDITEVVIEDLQVAEVANSPNSFRYMIKIRKYIKPPEPPATGLLDGGILDDALSLTDALDLIDGLGSIPDLGDPTQPLRQTLDGVKSGTSELDQTVNDLKSLFGEEPPSAEEAIEEVPSEVVPSAEDLRIDPADPRIDGATGSALESMLQSAETAEDAARLVRGINDGTLAGILGDDSDAAKQLADAYGAEPSSLVPPGQDAALVLDPVSPLEAPPTILLRTDAPDVRDDPARLGDALQEVGRTFELFQRGELGPCDSTPSATPVPNLVPSTFCRVPPGTPGPEEEKIDPSAPDLQIDPADPNIDVGAKFALQRMLKVPGMAADAARLIRGINSKTLAGIFGDDLGVAVQVAREHGTERWLLVPKGEDAALVLDAAAPLDAPPTVIFRGDTPDIRDKPTRIDPALQDTSQLFKLWQRGELGSCDSKRWVVPVPNLVPSSYCTSMGIPPGTSACSTLKRPEILDYFDQGRSDLKLSHKRKISVIARCVKDRHGTPNQIDAISLIGHASTEGDPSFNESLGQRRAEEVRKDLVIAIDREMPGLSGELQIDTETRGPRESRNLGPEKDRRVEVFLPVVEEATSHISLLMRTNSSCYPLSNIPYRLHLHDRVLDSMTDTDGLIEVEDVIPDDYVLEIAGHTTIVSAIPKHVSRIKHTVLGYYLELPTIGEENP